MSNLYRIIVIWEKSKKYNHHQVTPGGEGVGKELVNHSATPGGEGVGKKLV
jgi:hypothetical protein